MDKRKLKKLIMAYLVDQEEYNTFTTAELLEILTTSPPVAGLHVGCVS